MINWEIFDFNRAFDYNHETETDDNGYFYRFTIIDHNLIIAQCQEDPYRWICGFKLKSWKQ